MRKVIVNSTPIIALGKTGQLSILKDMYGEIIIPMAVYQEVTVKNDIVKTMLMQNQEWIHIEKVSEEKDRRLYHSRLHDGEVEVMMLAQELKADLVVIDDGAARKMAEYLELPLTGTIGILIKAKKMGIIENVMPVIECMRVSGIFFSDKLIEMVKQISGE